MIIGYPLKVRKWDRFYCFFPFIQNKNHCPALDFLKKYSQYKSLFNEF